MTKKDLLVPGVISSIIFIINPLLSVLFLIFIISFFKKNDKIYFLLFFLMSFFLGLINTTRSIYEGDLVAYSNSFKIASSLDLVSFLKSTFKEPLYYIFMFFTNKISSANFKVFIIVHTTIAYFFYFLSIFKINKKLTRNYSNQLFVFLLAALFFTLFSLSAHLMRQFIATSILLYFLVNKLFYNRNYWMLFVAAVLCHTSVIFFLPFLFSKTLGEKVKLKNLAKSIFQIASILIVFVFINLYFLDGVGPFSQISNRVLTDDSFDDGNSTALISIILTIILLILSIITIYFNKRNYDGWIYFNHLIIFSSILVLSTINSYPLISYRYCFYLYFFFPIVFGHFFRKRNSNIILTIIRPILVISIILFFGYKIDNSVFSYMPLSDIVKNPAIFYFFDN
jgi:hypothetical protein